MRLDGEQLGHYRLTCFLRGGGMGEVYLAGACMINEEIAQIQEVIVSGTPRLKSGACETASAT